MEETLLQQQDYENRKFMIFSTSELDQIDFTQVLETDADTVRKSVDGLKTFVKWDGLMPQCVQDLTTKEGPYTYDEILQILATPEWTDPMPFPPFEGTTSENIVAPQENLENKDTLTVE